MTDRVMSIFTNWPRTDGRTHTAIIVNTCVSCNTAKTLNTFFTGTSERISGYILEQSVSVRAFPELIGGRFFVKASSPFCIPVARQCYKCPCGSRVMNIL